VRRGSQSLTGTGRPLYDYFSLANLYEPCASLSTRAAGSPGAAFVPAALATVPRGGTPGAAPAITTANVPPISSAPATGISSRSPATP
jgi:hydroxybutyrate-dimer hydrolase